MKLEVFRYYYLKFRLITPSILHYAYVLFILFCICSERKVFHLLGHPSPVCFQLALVKLFGDLVQDHYHVYVLSRFLPTDNTLHFDVFSFNIHLLHQLCRTTCTVKVGRQCQEAVLKANRILGMCDNYRVSGALEKLEHETILQDRASDR